MDLDSPPCSPKGDTPDYVNDDVPRNVPEVSSKSRNTQSISVNSHGSKSKHEDQSGGLQEVQEDNKVSSEGFFHGHSPQVYGGQFLHPSFIPQLSSYHDDVDIDIEPLGFPTSDDTDIRSFPSPHSASTSVADTLRRDLGRGGDTTFPSRRRGEESSEFGNHVPFYHRADNHFDESTVRPHSPIVPCSAGRAHSEKRHEKDASVDHPIVQLSSHSLSIDNKVQEVPSLIDDVREVNTTDSNKEYTPILDPYESSPPSRSTRRLVDSKRRPSIRPVSIKPVSRGTNSALHSATSIGRTFSPYNIPLPLSATSRQTSSSSISFMTPLISSKPSTPSQIQLQQSKPAAPGGVSVDNVNITPPGSATHQLGSPSGTMSSMASGKRRPAPQFPSSPRERNIASHRELIARSAGLPPVNYTQTPAILRVPPTAQWSPAFHRSGYTSNAPRPHGGLGPYKIPASPGYPAPPHTAIPSYHRKSSTSAPTNSESCMPDQPGPPSGAQIMKTPQGTVKMRNVPVAWVVKELNRQAPRLWVDINSADCCIVIPSVSGSSPRTNRASAGTPTTADSAFSVHSNQPGRSYWPPTPVGTVQPSKDFNSGVGKGKEDVISAVKVENARGRRGSLPEYDQVPVMVFPMHQDYLITQSKLLRHLLSSTPAHLDMPVPQRTAIVAGEKRSPTTEGRLKGARIISGLKDQPTTIIVPLPDPECWGLIAHWLYWGDASVVDEALCRGLVSWTGLVQCIDYLDLDNTIKKIVGSWWRRWIKTEQQGRERSKVDEKWLDDDVESDVSRTVKKGGSDDGADDGNEGDDDMERSPLGDDHVDDDVLGALEKL